MSEALVSETNSEPPLVPLDSVAAVVEWLQESRAVVWTMGVSESIEAYPEPGTDRRHILIAGQSDWGLVRKDDDGLFGRPSGVLVPLAVLQEMQALMSDQNSEVRRLSSLPIVRAFVYLDISDFSQLPTGVQLLVIQSLVKLAAQAEKTIGYAEAKLCIGDGYIYVWDDAVGATRFAGALAREIEDAVAKGRAPEFHFRIGVHIGPVRCFRDPGRNGDWNYVGDGINGGNRVLSAIGKETDDVVFVSGQVRTAILKNDSINKLIVPHLLNRGRKADKHGRHWRVYEYHHSFPA
jgi:class 3 adenylate cyclase